MAIRDDDCSLLHTFESGELRATNKSIDSPFHSSHDSIVVLSSVHPFLHFMGPAIWPDAFACICLA